MQIVITGSLFKNIYITTIYPQQFKANNPFIYKYRVSIKYTDLCNENCEISISHQWLSSKDLTNQWIDHSSISLI